MSNQIVISSGAKVRSLEGVLTGTAGIVNSVPLGGANGVATLDSMGKVPLSQLPASVVTYLGTWNAATNTPTLTNGVGDVGDLYICNVAGTVNFGAGPITFAVGDWVIYNGSQWQKSSGASGTVTSVAVTESGDALSITGSPIVTAGTINIGFAGTGSQYIKGDGTLATFPTTIDQAKRLITEVYNSTGATLSKGTVVYINGGQGNLPTVTKAQANADNTSAQTYGVVQSDITNNNNGFVVVIGSLTDIDTQAYAVGTQLYLSGTTAGDWTSTKPSAPIHLVYVGIVVRSHPTQGVVEIRIQNGYELEELHDVAISSPLNNQGIFYNSSNDLWENKSIATALGYTPANDALVVHLAGTETITGAKTFTDNTIFSASPLFDQSANYKVGAPLVGTGNYISMAFDKSGTGSGSILSMKLADGTTAKAINLDFLGSPATYTYTFPASSGTLALTSDLGNYVTLATTQTITGAKTIDNSINIRDFVLINGDGGSTNGGLAIKQYASAVAASTGYTSLFARTSQLGINYGAAFNTFIDGSGLTANRTLTIPDISGTLALLEGTQTFSGNKTFSALTAFTFLNGTRMDYGLYLSKGSVPSAFSGSTVNLYSDSGNNNLVVRDNSNTSLLQFQAASSYTYTFPASSGTLALTSNLSSYVPYTGATTNVDLGSNFLKARTFYSEGSGGGGSYAIKNGTTPSFEDGYTILSSNDYRLNIVSTVSAATKAVYFGFSGVTATRTYTLPDASGTLALTSNLSSYVPYTGATAAVDLGNYDLTVYGIKVGRGAGSISTNIVLGASALSSNTTGSINTSIGTGSLQANTTGSANTAIGNVTLNSNLTGQNNTAIGNTALSMTTSSYNTGIGAGSLANNTSGSYNTGLGYGSGSSITTGSYNVIIGSYTGTSGMSNNIVLADGQGNIRYQWNGTTNNFNGAATFSRNDAGNISVTVANAYINQGNLINFQQNNAGSTLNAYIGHGGDSTGNFVIMNNGITPLTLAKATGAATFSSSIALSASSGFPAVGLLNRSSDNNLYMVAASSGFVLLDNSQNTMYNATPTSHTWLISNSPKMTLNSSGNVEIQSGSLIAKSTGTGTPAVYLRADSGSNNGTLGFGNSTDYRIRGGSDYAAMIFDTAGTERMRITSGGMVGIGTTGASDVRLFVRSAGAGAGTYNIYSRDSNNVDLFVIRDDGYGYLKANAWAYGSDRRIKENISYIETGLDKVLALKPAKFDYIDGVKNNIGWIAQDVQEVIPEAVNTISERNDQLTLKSDFIIPYLVKAIQEQNEIIKKQGQAIEELKALINK